ncbi:MAG: hypothetical protein AB7T22_16920 [Calditrichaceae bacterium]
MKQVYIHIGPPKTGTTTIQHSLFLNRDKLLQNGVYIPHTGSLVDKAHHYNLGWELIGEKKFNKSKGTWGDLLDELRKVEVSKIILSSEGFIRCTDDNIRTMKEYLSDYETFIVFYVRRQDKKIQSQWAQGAKSPYRPDVDITFLDWIENNIYQFSFSDYYEIYHQWKRVFGDNILIRVVEKGQLQGTLFEDFLTTIGVENPQQYQTSNDMNVSPGIKTLSMILEYKRLLGTKIDEKKLLRIIRVIKDYGEENGWNDEKWSFLTREMYDKIMSQYEESNRKLALEYFQRDQLFFEPFEEKNVIRPIIDFPPVEVLGLNTRIIESIYLHESSNRQQNRPSLKRYLIQKTKSLIKRIGFFK